MPRKLLITLLAAVSLIAACDTASPDLEPDVVVMRAFLFAGEAVDDVQLTTTSSLTSTEEEGAPIADAAVFLVKTEDPEVFYPLAPEPGEAGFYHYEGDDLSVAPGDTFVLAVDYQERLTTAATYIPREPEAVTLSTTHVVINAATAEDLPVLTVAWDNPGDELHWVSIRNTATVLVPIRRDDVGEPAEAILPDPVDDAFYEVNAGAFTHYGTHEVRVYRVSSDYFALYQYTQQPVQRIYEPATNVENGVGIFSGFTGVSYTITVQPR